MCSDQTGWRHALSVHANRHHTGKERGVTLLPAFYPARLQLNAPLQQDFGENRSGKLELKIHSEFSQETLRCGMPKICPDYHCAGKTQYGDAQDRRLLGIDAKSAGVAERSTSLANFYRAESGIDCIR